MNFAGGLAPYACYPAPFPSRVPARPAAVAPQPRSDVSTLFTLSDLARTIAERAEASPGESYTAKLLQHGPAKAAKKLGEEAVEAVIAAMQGDREALVAEAADVLYHLLVVLKAGDVRLEEVMNELERRTAQSGLAEKASRSE